MDLLLRSILLKHLALIIFAFTVIIVTGDEDRERTREDVHELMREIQFSRSIRV